MLMFILLAGNHNPPPQVADIFLQPSGPDRVALDLSFGGNPWLVVPGTLTPEALKEITIQDGAVLDRWKDRSIIGESLAEVIQSFPKTHTSFIVAERGSICPNYFVYYQPPHTNFDIFAGRDAGWDTPFKPVQRSSAHIAVCCRDEVLLVERAGDHQFALPSGEQNETDGAILNTAIRELLEESGITLDKLAVIGKSTLLVDVENRTYYNNDRRGIDATVFLAQIDEKPTIEIKDTKEIVPGSARWVPLSTFKDVDLTKPAWSFEISGVGKMKFDLHTRVLAHIENKARTSSVDQSMPGRTSRVEFYPIP